MPPADRFLRLCSSRSATFEAAPRSESTCVVSEQEGREALTLKRSLVNGAQRLELVGWSAARLDWYKAQGCFTEIIRYQTRLFVPAARAVEILERL